MRNLDIYIHVPFCLSKCIYCDFYSVPLSIRKNGLLWKIAEESRKLTKKYAEAVKKELNLYKDNGFLTERKIDAVYFGGGTPSIMTPSDIEEILSAVRRNAYLADDAEITIETNPATAGLEELSGFRKAGVNRISIGCQSFVEEELQILGRRHSISDAGRIIKDARAAGFENLSLDLIFGVPGSNSGRWNESLSKAIEFHPEHISCYGMTVEEGTQLSGMINDGSLTLPGDEEQREMYLEAAVIFKSAGLNQYEISNFARQDYECRNNLNYWNGGEYLGLGASAHSCAVKKSLSGILMSRKRRWNIEDVDEYMNRCEKGLFPEAGGEEVTGEKLAGEAVMLGLRMTEGIDIENFKKQYGVELLSKWGKEIGCLQDAGLLAVNDGRMLLTIEGVLLSNEVFSEFMAG
ncbi:MAG: radical SAM family heme chaperone HemW [Candidatus Schekmanbacteria bacterium]|nr:radical SAM family heme chaperone HemW [Candidatus Schekmanbacteria bacterium]